MKNLILGTTILFAGSALSQNGAQNRFESKDKPAVPRLSTDLLMNGGAPENEALKQFLLTPPKNSQQLVNKNIAILTSDGVEEIELLAPRRFLEERGAKVDIVSPRFVPPDKKLGIEYPAQRESHILTVRFFENGQWVKIDRFLDQVAAGDYNAIIIAGGAWNPDSLRSDPQALQLIRSAVDQNTVIAAICHGPQVFINAGIIKNRRVTGFWNIQLDLSNAGAKVIDEPVVVDGNIVTSRYPLDLPQFMAAITDRLTQNPI
ncbi:MAG: type 1 glutamine amidotransferase [Oligoflexales bacterium]|nr:type 1 glutamine amidotransferase [Oligoflexales bacterium]